MITKAFDTPVAEFINKLGTIDLDTQDAFDLICKLFTELPHVPLFTVSLSKGSTVFRCRPNDGMNLFEKIQDLSQPPAEKVNYFGRCNSPGQSTFYASEASEYSFIEHLHRIDSKLSCGDFAYVTVGEWTLLDDLRLAVVLNPTNAGLMERYMRIFENDFNSVINHEPEDEQSGMRRFFKFMADQFAEPAFNDDRIYKVTCAYANHALRNNKDKIDGLIYPSIAYHSYGINYCLKPDVVTNARICLTGAQYFTYQKTMSDSGSSEFIELVNCRRKTSSIDLKTGRVLWRSSDNP